MHATAHYDKDSRKQKYGKLSLTKTKNYHISEIRPNSNSIYNDNWEPAQRLGNTSYTKSHDNVKV